MILTATEICEGLRIAENIRDNIESLSLRHPADDIDNVTVSIGCSNMVSNIESHQTLFKLADERLYTAKQAGRNCIA